MTSVLFDLGAVANPQTPGPAGLAQLFQQLQALNQNLLQLQQTAVTQQDLLQLRTDMQQDMECRDLTLKRNASRVDDNRRRSQVPEPMPFHALRKYRAGHPPAFAGVYQGRLYSPACKIQPMIPCACSWRRRASLWPRSHDCHPNSDQCPNQQAAWLLQRS